MKALAIAALVLLAGCPRTLSDADRAALQDFRAVERVCLARADELLRDESMHLSDPADLVKTISSDLVKPWQDMRTRVKIEERKLGDELSKVLGRYLDERQLAWEALAKAVSSEAYFIQTTENHRWQYRESNDAANADQKTIEVRLAALKLPALPPPAGVPIVELDVPPPDPAPGAAFFLTGHDVVRLDDNGFQRIATDIDTMDVWPDGTMWACSMWHVVHWDGTKATEYKPKIPVTACAAGPDGVLWALDDRHYQTEVDQLGRFDGKTWKIVRAAIGDPGDETAALVVDRDGRLYANNRGSMGGDHVFILDKTWRQLALQGVSESSYVNHLARGADGYIWATYQVSKNGNYPSGFSRLQPGGSDELAWAADYFQQEQVYPFIDAAGVWTVLDPRRNVLEQAKKKRTLPLPVAQRYHVTDSSGPFWIDGAGRIWIDLVDGINVIDKGGKRTVYPRGSVTAIVENVTKIVVTGAGPKLVAPSPVATRTITGQLQGGKLELAMCAEPWGRECPLGLARWTTFSDAEGNFTFENVPRWKLTIYGLTGLSGQKEWRTLGANCCVDTSSLGEVSFRVDSIY